MTLVVNLQSRFQLPESAFVTYGGRSSAVEEVVDEEDGDAGGDGAAEGAAVAKAHETVAQS